MQRAAQCSLRVARARLKSQRMKGAFLADVGRIEVLDAPAPQPSARENVLVRMDAVGVCGSDVHYYRQGGIGDQRVNFPWIMGHECSGTVIEVAPGVKGLVPGDRVAIDPLLACGECDQCRSGRRHTCRNQKFLGVPGQTPGALAERMALPAECCIPVPATMSAPQAVMVEPFSIALYSVRLAKPRPDARVAVLGTGPIGLSVMLALRATVLAGGDAGGGGFIYATDLVAERLEAARRVGANWTGNPHQNDVVAAISQLEPRGLDCVFECAGEQETLDQAVALLKPGGTLSMVGIPEAAHVRFDPHALRRNELRILNVRRQNECTRDAIDLISSGRVNVDPLITHHFPLAETAKAFELVSSCREGVLKAIIDLPQE
jgi:L-iditol 2-dehydrogenase